MTLTKINIIFLILFVATGFHSCFNVQEIPAESQTTVIADNSENIYEGNHEEKTEIIQSDYPNDIPKDNTTTSGTDITEFFTEEKTSEEKTSEENYPTEHYLGYWEYLRPFEEVQNYFNENKKFAGKIKNIIINENYKYVFILRRNPEYYEDKDRILLETSKNEVEFMGDKNAKFINDIVEKDYILNYMEKNCLYYIFYSFSHIYPPNNVLFFMLNGLQGFGYIFDWEDNGYYDKYDENNLYYGWNIKQLENNWFYFEGSQPEPCLQ